MFDTNQPWMLEPTTGIQVPDTFEGASSVEPLDSMGAHHLEIGLLANWSMPRAALDLGDSKSRAMNKGSNPAPLRPFQEHGNHNDIIEEGMPLRRLFAHITSLEADRDRWEEKADRIQMNSFRSKAALVASLMRNASRVLVITCLDSWRYLCKRQKQARAVDQLIDLQNKEESGNVAKLIRKASYSSSRIIAARTLRTGNHMMRRLTLSAWCVYTVAVRKKRHGFMKLYRFVHHQWDWRALMVWIIPAWHAAVATARGAKDDILSQQRLIKLREKVTSSQADAMATRQHLSVAHQRNDALKGCLQSVKTNCSACLRNFPGRPFDARQRSRDSDKLFQPGSGNSSQIPEQQILLRKRGGILAELKHTASKLAEATVVLDDAEEVELRATQNGTRRCQAIQGDKELESLIRSREAAQQYYSTVERTVSELYQSLEKVDGAFMSQEDDALTSSFMRELHHMNGCLKSADMRRMKIERGLEKEVRKLREEVTDLQGRLEAERKHGTAHIEHCKNVCSTELAEERKKQRFIVDQLNEERRWVDYLESQRRAIVNEELQRVGHRAELTAVASHLDQLAQDRARLLSKKRAGSPLPNTACVSSSTSHAHNNVSLGEAYASNVIPLQHNLPSSPVTSERLAKNPPSNYVSVQQEVESLHTGTATLPALGRDGASVNWAATVQSSSAVLEDDGYPLSASQSPSVGEVDEASWRLQARATIATPKQSLKSELSAPATVYPKPLELEHFGNPFDNVIIPDSNTHQYPFEAADLHGADVASVTHRSTQQFDRTGTLLAQDDTHYQSSTSFDAPPSLTARVANVVLGSCPQPNLSDEKHSGLMANSADQFQLESTSQFVSALSPAGSSTGGFGFNSSVSACLVQAPGAKPV